MDADKPKVRLVGEDGNAFAILGRCKRAADKAGWPQDRWESFQKKATSGDYDNLLRTVMEQFDADPVEDDE